MTKTSTSFALEEAEELLKTLPFDCRYGTHLRGKHVSITVTIIPGAAEGKVTGMLYCHAFGHLRPDWNRIEVFLDYVSNVRLLKFDNLGAARFECDSPTGEERTFHLYAYSLVRDDIVVVPEEIMTSASGFESNPRKALPITVDKISLTKGLAASAQFKGGVLQLVFQTASDGAGWQVLFWLGTADGVNVATGRKGLLFSPTDRMWRTQWLGGVAMPREATSLRLVYWTVPPPGTGVR
jgi:hypothetical protein